MRSLRAMAVLLAAACGGGQRTDEGPQPPPIPTGFTPAPRLGPEPAPTRSQPGDDWLEAVHGELHPRWADNFLEQSRVYFPPDHPLNQPGLEVTLRFAVSPEGVVRNVEVVKSSGNPDFDGAARELVTEASPLPKPPAALASDDGDVHVSWRFARDVRQDGVAGASIERVTWELERAVPALLAAGRVDEAASRVAAEHEAKLGGDGPARRHALARQVAGGALVMVLGSDEDPAARVDAARALAAAGYKEAAPALRTLAAEGNDIGVQTAALRALGELRDEEAEPVLTEALTRVDGERGAAAAEALVKLGKGEAVWATLGPRAGGDDERLRESGIEELVDAGLPQSQPVLVKALGDRGRPRAERVAAAQGLGLLAKDPAAMRALVAALADGDAAVRAAAAAGMGRAAQAGVKSRAAYFAVEPLLRDRDPRVQAAAVRAAAKLDGKAALAELGTVGARARDPQLIAATVESVGEIPGGEALAQLRRWAGSKNPDVRTAALGALVKRGEPEARAVVARAVKGEGGGGMAPLAVAASDDAGVLRKALGDTSPEVRAAAVRPLVRVAGVDAGVAAALRALADSPGGRERVLIGREILGVVPR